MSEKRTCPVCQQKSELVITTICIDDHSSPEFVHPTPIRVIECRSCKAILAFLGDAPAVAVASPEDSVRLRVSALESRLEEAKVELTEMETHRKLGTRRKIIPL